MLCTLAALPVRWDAGLERTLSRQKFERKPPKFRSLKLGVARGAGDAYSDQRKLSDRDALWLTGQHSSYGRQCRQGPKRFCASPRRDTSYHAHVDRSSDWHADSSSLCLFIGKGGLGIKHGSRQYG